MDKLLDFIRIRHGSNLQPYDPKSYRVLLGTETRQGSDVPDNTLPVQALRLACFLSHPPRVRLLMSKRAPSVANSFERAANQSRYRSGMTWYTRLSLREREVDRT